MRITAVVLVDYVDVVQLDGSRSADEIVVMGSLPPQTLIVSMNNPKSELHSATEPLGSFQFNLEDGPWSWAILTVLSLEHA